VAVQGGDFLDMEHYPQINFVSTAVEWVEGDSYTMTGDLSIKGTTRPVTLHARFIGATVDPFGNVRAGFEGTSTLKPQGLGRGMERSA
jgi:polyisoprenoid-binding protein YceI